MALGDGIRRNIAHIDPAERAALRDAIIQLHSRYLHCWREVSEAYLVPIRGLLAPRSFSLAFLRPLS